MTDNKIAIVREVNTDTGEIRNKDNKWVQLDMEFVNSKSSKFKGIDKTENNGKRFFNLVADFQISLKQKYNISFEDMGKLLLLFTYTSYRKTDTKKHYLQDNNHMFDSKKLSTVLKLNSEQTKKFKARIKKKGILKEDDIGMYFSDDLLIRGKMYPKEKRDLSFYTLYDEPIRELYNMFAVEGDTKSVKPLGVFLTLVPFIKKVSKEDKMKDRKGSNNMLVMAEYNEVADRYEAISLTKLAELIGISKPTLIKDIKTLNDFTNKETGEFLIWKNTNTSMPIGYEKYKHTTEAIFIHPRFTYSQDKTSQEYFDLTKAIKNAKSDNVLQFNDYKN